MKQELLNIGFQEDSKDKNYMSLSKFPIKNIKTKKANQQDHSDTPSTIKIEPKSMYSSLEDIYGDYNIENFPWNVNKLKISVESKDSRLSYREVNLQLDFDKIHKNISSLVNAMYPGSSVEFARSKTEGIWCIVEFTNPDYKINFIDPINPFNNKKNVCGFRFYFTKSKEDISILVTDHFYLGKTPELFLQQSVLLIAKSIGIQLEQNHLYSIYEYKFNLNSIISSIFNTYFPEEKDLSEYFSEASRRTKINIVSGTNELIVSSTEKDKLDFKKIPIAVLESRENFSKNLLLDSNILTGKPIRQDSESIYYLRRLLMNPSYKPEADLSHIEAIYQTEPDFLIFKSYILYQHLKSDKDSALNLLSEFSLYFYENIVDFKKINSLNYILHKLLGDMWFYQDLYKAEQCYTKLLNKKYIDNSTDIDTLILLKEVKKKESNTNELRQYLLRILELKPEEDVEGQIQYELFEISRTSSKTIASSIDHGLSCLSISKDINVLFKVIETMKELKLYTESIDLINSYLNEQKEELSSLQLSELKYISSDIWYNCIKRKDMAEEQITDALNYNPNNTDAIDLLINVQKDNNNNDEVIKLLNKEIFIIDNELKAISHQKNDDEFDTNNEVISSPQDSKKYNQLLTKLQKLKLDLFNIYLYNKDNKLAATKVFIGISSSKFDHSKLNELLNTNFLVDEYDNFNWNIIHEVLSDSIVESKNEINELLCSAKLKDLNYELSTLEQEQINYFIQEHITLAKLCSNKLHCDYLSARHLTELKDICILNTNLLKFISMTLINNNDQDNLYKLFVSQYNINPIFVNSNSIPVQFETPNELLNQDSSKHTQDTITYRQSVLKDIVQEITRFLDTTNKYFVNYIDIIIDYYRSYPNQESVIYAVSEKLSSPSTLDKLEMFTEQIISKLDDTDIILSVLNLNINYLLYLNCPDKNKTLFFLFKRKFSLTPLNSKEMIGILSGFNWEQNKNSQSLKQYLKYFINLLLESREDVPLPVSESINILEDDPIVLNKYYKNLLLKDNPNISNTKICERILEYYIALKDVNTVSKVIEKLFDDSIPQSFTNSLKQLAFNANCEELQEKILYQNDGMDSNQVLKLLDMAKTYEHENPSKSSKIYCSILDRYEIADFEYFHEIITFAQNIQDNNLEEKALLKCVLHPMFESNVNKYEKYVVILCNKYDKKNEVQEILTNLFNSYLLSHRNSKSDSSWDQLIYLAELLKKLELSTYQSLIILIKNDVKAGRKSFKQYSDNIIDCINSVNSTEEIRYIYSELEEIFSSKNEKKLLNDFLLVQLDNEGFDLSTQIYNELKILVCINMYNSYIDENSKLNKNIKSLPIILEQLLSVLESNANDERIIMPLYHLHLLYKTKDELCHYLSIVYPTISQKPQILDDDISLKEIQQLISSYNKNIDSNSTTFEKDSSLNWRQAIVQNTLSSSVVTMIANQAFEKDLEKHVALQTIALVSGDLSILNDWHLNVWRHPENYIYSLNYKEHFPETGIPEFLYTRYYKLISMLIPALSSLCKDILSIKGYVKTKKINYQYLKSKARYVKWDATEFIQCGIHKFTITSLYTNLNIVDLPISSTDIVYDPRKSTIYLDLSYFKKFPHTVLLHTLLHTLWAIRLKYYVLLTLPSPSMMPLFNYLKEYFSNSVVKKVKDLFKTDISPIDALLNRLNKADFYRVYSKLQGNISEKQITLLKNACNTHIERLQLADSLDIIGFIEYKSHIDLISKGQITPEELTSLVPNIQSILNYILSLNI